MGNETTGIIMPIYSDMLLNSEDPKVLILPASVDKAIIVTTKNNKRLDEVLEELERSGGTIKSIELNGDTVAIGENGTVNLGNLLSGESLKTINNEGLVGNTNINLINAVFGKYGTEGNVTTFLVSRINDNIESFVPATASEHTLYIDVYNNKIYRYVDNEYVVALDTSGFALKTELDEKANASDVVPNTRMVNNKPLSGDVTIGMSDIPGLEEAIGQIEAGEQIAFDAGGTAIIDSASSPNADTVLGAASARWVKEIDSNVKAILAALANIAFTDTKPTWQNVAKRKFDLTMTSLTGCSGSVQTGDAGNNQVYEGLVVIRLIPSTGYAFTSISVTKTSGGDAITFERSEVSGYTEISFVCSEAVTVAAVATEGLSISLSGTNSTHLHLTKSSIPVGTTVYEDTLSADTHWNLPSTIAATVNEVPITFDGTTNSYDNTTGAIKISGVNGDVVITANAVEDSYITLDVTGVGEHVDVTNQTDGGSDTKVYTETAKTIQISPAIGYKFTSNGTPTASSGTLSGSGVYEPYSLVIPASATGTITIAASVEAKLTKSVSWSGTGFKLYDAASGGNELTSPVTVNENDTFEAWVITEKFYVIDSVSGATYDSSTNRIYVTNVSDNISISISTSRNDNVPFKGVWYEHMQSGKGWLHVGNLENGVVSPLIDLGENRSTSKTVWFSTTGTSNSNNNCHLILFNSSGAYTGYFAQTDAEREKELTTDYRYIRLQFNKDCLSTAYIRDGEDSYLFQGSDYSLDNMATADDFLESSYCPQPNSNGDRVGWSIATPNHTGSTVNSNNGATTQSSIASPTNSIFCAIGGQAALPTVLSKWFTIPSNIQLAICCGILGQSNALWPRMLYANTESGGYNTFQSADTGMDANTGVRAVTFDDKYTKGRMLLTTTGYNLNGTFPYVFVRDLTNGNDLWGDSTPYYESLNNQVEE